MSTRQIAGRKSLVLLSGGAFPELADEMGLNSRLVGEQQLLPGFLTLAVLPVGLVLAFRPGPVGGRRGQGRAGHQTRIPWRRIGSLAR